jgi:glycosyltransferase involved in cell wall biosynthesis
VGGCSELIYGTDDRLGESGMLVPMMNPSAIASAIKKMGMDKKLMKKMGTIGKKRVKKYYTAEKCIESYKNIYDSFK